MIKYLPIHGIEFSSSLFPRKSKLNCYFCRGDVKIIEFICNKPVDGLQIVHGVIRCNNCGALSTTERKIEPQHFVFNKLRDKESLSLKLPNNTRIIDSNVKYNCRGCGKEDNKSYIYKSQENIAFFITRCTSCGFISTGRTNNGRIEYDVLSILRKPNSNSKR